MQNRKSHPKTRVERKTARRTLTERKTVSRKSKVKSAEQDLTKTAATTTTTTDQVG